MEVKDVKKLKQELNKAVAEMIVSFEGETGCFVEDFVIDREGGKPWLVNVETVVEI